MDRKTFRGLIARLAVMNATYSRWHDAWTISVTELMAVYRRYIELAPHDLPLIHDAIADGAREGLWQLDRSMDATDVLLLLARPQHAQLPQRIMPARV